MLKEFALGAIYLVFFNLLIAKAKRIQLSGFKPWVTLALFNIKFATGIFIWAVYTFYYKDTANNDVHKFYNDAVQLNNLAHTNTGAFADLMFNGDSYPEYAGQVEMQHWYRNFDEAPVNENRTIIRINALLMFVSLKAYFVHVLVMCFLSLLGWVLILKSIHRYIMRQADILSLLTMLLPSVLFWTSGVLKEPILVLGTGLFTHGLIGTTFETGKLKAVLFLFAGAVVLLSIKFYVLACLLPASLAFLLWPRVEAAGRVLIKYAAVTVVLLAIAFNIKYVVPQINPAQMLANKQHNSVKEAKYFNAGSRIDIPEVEGTAQSIIATAPAGIWNTIARPYPWEGRNPMMLFSAFENLLVLALILASLFLFSPPTGNTTNLLLFLFSFSLAYFALIGICTPVLGNLVRYRAPVLPFFILGFTLLAAGNKLYSLSGIAFIHKLIRT